MSALCIFNKQLGDMVLLQPALAKLCNLHGRQIDLLTKPAFEPLIELMPSTRLVRFNPLKTYSDLYCYDQGSRSFWQSLGIFSRRKHLVTLSQTYITRLHRMAFHHHYSEYLCKRYVGRYYWDCTPGKEGARYAPPSLKLPAEDWKPSGLPSSYLVVNPCSAWQSKSYSAENWRLVIKKLTDQYGLPVVIVGGKLAWQQKLCADLSQGWTGRQVINFCAKTSLREYLYILGSADLVLTVDGSASHLAQAFGGKTIVLFGPTKPEMWHWATPQNKALVATPLEGERKASVNGNVASVVISAAQNLLDERG